MTIGAKHGGKPRRVLKCLVFDLDDTLYRSKAVSHQVVEGIQKFMVKHLGYDTREAAVAKATELYCSYGTTLAGLVASGAKIDFVQWHEEVHYGHVDYDNHIHPDVALREMLFSMDLPKYVFTNADARHAEICLRRLGIEDCFQGVFHFELLEQLADAAGMHNPSSPCVICKPSHAAYDLVFKTLGVHAEEVLFFDDSARNIKAAHELGVMTVMVGTDQPVAGADLSMPDLHHLPRMLPELIDQPGMVKDVPHGHEHDHMVASSVEHLPRHDLRQLSGVLPALVGQASSTVLETVSSQEHEPAVVTVAAS